MVVRLFDFNAFFFSCQVIIWHNFGNVKTVELKYKLLSKHFI